MVSLPQFQPPTRDILASHPLSFGLCESLSPGSQGGNVFTGDTVTIPLDFVFQLLTHHFRLLRQESSSRGKVTDSHYQKMSGLGTYAAHCGDGDPLGPCPVRMEEERGHTPWLEKGTGGRGSGPSGVRVRARGVWSGWEGEDA